jgi:RNA polymerase sigma-70 factor (ECF subfamily)
MQYRDETDIGGVGRAFLTTHWSLIGDIQSQDEGNRALIGLLLDRYWKPIYFYLRRKGISNEAAKDLTQAFFHEVVLNRNLIQRADQTKGRFRTFLLHALEQFLIDECNKKRSASKRIPAYKIVSFDQFDTPELPQAIATSDTQESYNFGWMASLLDQILSQVETKCMEQGLDLHWKIFHDRIVGPILENTDPPSLDVICRKYRISDKKKASNLVITVKRCFKATLLEYVRSTVTSEDEFDEELAEIMRLFGNRAQHF